ncbi:MAG: hypothetical protein JSR67_15115 [Proteobacteria bacterium]|nr:hypothetical protein [Pseudomonadota bacterium]
MKPTKPSVLRLLPLAAIFAVGGAQAQSLNPNQTEGFSHGGIVKFTYQQNFACVHQPRDDLDYNGMLAQSDAGEFQTPICQAGIQPTIDPTGRHARKTATLYVLVPMFSLDGDQNPGDAIPCPAGVRASTLCGPALGKVLIQLFGAVPEAYKAKPLVFTDCPGPGSMPGTCTMHASTVDLGKVLVALGKLPPPAANVFLPTPNHSHVINNSRANTEKAIWWEVKPVLVTEPSVWPDQAGDVGITSVRKMDEAEQRGQAVEVPSNFFLFFSSKSMQDMHDDDD